MKDARIAALKFGVFAVVAALLLVTLVNTMHHGLSGKTRDYTADFTDVSGLRVGDDVKVAGVRVGRVQDISATDQIAKVDFQMDDNQPILSNTKLVMRYQNLVGQRYLAMMQPKHHGTQLPSGATIPTSRTDPGFDLTALLNGFRPLFEVLQPQDVNKLARSLVQVLQGEGGTVDSILRQTTHLTQYVASRDKVIGRVLTNLTPVLNDFDRHDKDFNTSVDALTKLMKGLAADRKSIGASVDGLSKLVGSTNRLVTNAKQPLIDSVHDLRTVTAMLASSRGDLIAAIEGFRSAFNDLGRGTSYENALNIYICSLKLGVGGLAPLNPLGGGSMPGVCQ